MTRVTALRDVRGELERRTPGSQPHGSAGRDPSGISASAVLDAFGARGRNWHESYGFGYNGDLGAPRWQAWRHDGTGELLGGDTPDEMAAEILADWAGGVR